MAEPINGDPPPGLNSVAFGPGGRRAIFRRLRRGVAASPVLAPLARQSPDTDPTMALLDCWSMVGDVIGFYQERLANESYLRTAAQDRSLVELTAQIGYQVQTGVAASTPLAFTVGDAHGEDELTIAIGVQVQSIPKGEGTPQVFETIEEVAARRAWNALRAADRPAVEEVVPIDWSGKSCVLQGQGTRIVPGDALLFYGPAPQGGNMPWCVVQVENVAADAATTTTRITWAQRLAAEGDIEKEAAAALSLMHFRARRHVFGFNAPDWRAMPSQIKDAYCPANDCKDWPGFALSGDRAIDLDQSVVGQGDDGWFFVLDTDRTPSSSWLSAVKNASIVAQTNFTMSAQVSRLVGRTPYAPPSASIGAGDTLAAFSRRATVVYCNSAPQQLARTAQRSVVPVAGPRIEAAASMIGMQRGRKLIFCGPLPRVVAKVEGLTLVTADGRRIVIARGENLILENRPFPMQTPSGEDIEGSAGATYSWVLRNDNAIGGTVEATREDFSFSPARAEDPSYSAQAVIATAPCDATPKSLVLSAPLEMWFDPDRLQIFANVVLAGHGRTTQDTLGDGFDDAPPATVRLNHQPLTYISARTPSGRRSTMTLRVDGVLWREVETLYGQDANAAVYSLETDVHGDTWVRFGDGRSGRRPPAGYGRIKAVYRTGIGLDGEVAAGTLTVLLDAPMGIDKVNNPLGARGASALPQIRKSALLGATKTLSLGRIVSLSDYRDFTVGFAGIAKAEAQAYQQPSGVGVQVTIAAEDGAWVAPSAPLMRFLREAIIAHGDPVSSLRIVNYRRLGLGVHVALWLDPLRDPLRIKADVRDRLIDAFSFKNRALDDPITRAQVLRVVTAVVGVLLADVNFPAPPRPVDVSLTVGKSDRFPEPSQLQVLDPDEIALEEKS